MYIVCILTCVLTYLFFADQAKQSFLYLLFQNFISQKTGVILKEEDVAVSNVRIDLTRGRSNPLERYLKYDAFMLILD